MITLCNLNSDLLIKKLIKIALYYNRFRKKLDITKFDWTFTPNHKSS